MAIALLVLWGLMFAAVSPVRQAYVNGLIPSQERATVLSFDSLLGSSGAVRDSADARQGGRPVGISDLVRSAARRSRHWPFRSCGWRGGKGRNRTRCAFRFLREMIYTLALL